MIRLETIFGNPKEFETARQLLENLFAKGPNVGILANQLITDTERIMRISVAPKKVNPDQVNLLEITRRLYENKYLTTVGASERGTVTFDSNTEVSIPDKARTYLQSTYAED